jgi:hypothetical protein
LRIASLHKLLQLVLHNTLVNEECDKGRAAPSHAEALRGQVRSVVTELQQVETGLLAGAGLFALLRQRNAVVKRDPNFLRRRLRTFFELRRKQAGSDTHATVGAAGLDGANEERPMDTANGESTSAPTQEPDSEGEGEGAGSRTATAGATADAGADDCGADGDELLLPGAAATGFNFSRYRKAYRRSELLAFSRITVGRFEVTSAFQNTLLPEHLSGDFTSAVLDRLAGSAVACAALDAHGAGASTLTQPAAVTADSARMVPVNTADGGCVAAVSILACEASSALQMQRDASEVAASAAYRSLPSRLARQRARSARLAAEQRGLASRQLQLLKSFSHLLGASVDTEGLHARVGSSSSSAPGSADRQPTQLQVSAARGVRESGEEAAATNTGSASDAGLPRKRPRDAGSEDPSEHAGSETVKRPRVSPLPLAVDTDDAVGERATSAGLQAAELPSSDAAAAVAAQAAADLLLSHLPAVADEEGGEAEWLTHEEGEEDDEGEGGGDADYDDVEEAGEGEPEAAGVASMVAAKQLPLAAASAMSGSEAWDARATGSFASSSASAAGQRPGALGTQAVAVGGFSSVSRADEEDGSSHDNTGGAEDGVDGFGSAGVITQLHRYARLRAACRSSKAPSSAADEEGVASRAGDAVASSADVGDLLAGFVRADFVIAPPTQASPTQGPAGSGAASVGVGAGPAADALPTLQNAVAAVSPHADTLVDLVLQAKGAGMSVRACMHALWGLGRIAGTGATGVAARSFDAHRSTDASVTTSPSHERLAALRAAVSACPAPIACCALRAVLARHAFDPCAAASDGILRVRNRAVAGGTHSATDGAIDDRPLAMVFSAAEGTVYVSRSYAFAYTLPAVTGSVEEQGLCAAGTTAATSPFTAAARLPAHLWSDPLSGFPHVPALAKLTRALLHVLSDVPVASEAALQARLPALPLGELRMLLQWGVCAGLLVVAYEPWSEGRHLMLAAPTLFSDLPERGQFAARAAACAGLPLVSEAALQLWRQLPVPIDSTAAASPSLSATEGPVWARDEKQRLVDVAAYAPRAAALLRLLHGVVPDPLPLPFVYPVYSAAPQALLLLAQLWQARTGSASR